MRCADRISRQIKFRRSASRDFKMIFQFHNFLSRGLWEEAAKRERDTEKEVSGSGDPFSLWPLPSVFLFRGVAHFRGIRQTPCWRWNPRQMYWNLIWQSADWGQKSLDGRFRPSILHTTPLIFSWLFLFGWRHVLRCFPFLCSLHPRFIVTLSSRKVSCTFHFRANQRVGQQLCRWCVNRWLGFYGNKNNKTKL